MLARKCLYFATVIKYSHSCSSQPSGISTAFYSPVRGSFNKKILSHWIFHFLLAQEGRRRALNIHAHLPFWTISNTFFQWQRVFKMKSPLFFSLQYKRKMGPITMGASLWTSAAAAISIPMSKTTSLFMSRYLFKACGENWFKKGLSTAQGLQHLTQVKGWFLIPLLKVCLLQPAAHRKQAAESSPLSPRNGSKTRRITTNLERKHPRHNVIPPLDFIALTHNEQIPGESLSRELRRKPDPAPSCQSRRRSQPEPKPSSPPG